MNITYCVTVHPKSLRWFAVSPDVWDVLCHLPDNQLFTAVAGFCQFIGSNETSELSVLLKLL